jgi:hypothetical protein
MNKSRMYSTTNKILNRMENDSNGYVNARYSPTNPNEVGKPFPSYKQSAAQTFTNFKPSSDWVNQTKNRLNLPFNNNLYRQSVIDDGIDLMNENLNSWVNKSQTLGSTDGFYSCNSDSDCISYPGTTCNSGFMNWEESYGNQPGSFCSKTVYPEMMSGNFERKNSNQGGIGKSCENDTECGDGYYCNTTSNVFGGNVQQTGFCTNVYKCDGSEQKRFMGIVNNSGIPLPPPKNQNNFGNGYQTIKECESNKQPLQHCVKNKNKFFATYPAYCPIQNNLRSNGNPKGNIRTTNSREIDNGFVIPKYINVKQSNLGGKDVKAFSGYNIMSNLSYDNGSIDAFNYFKKHDPIPNNL